MLTDIRNLSQSRAPLCVVLLLAATSGAGAQRSAVIAANPLALFSREFVTAEAEIGAGRSTTLGVNGLWYYPVPEGGTRQHETNVEVALRYYTSGRRFHGFSIAPTVGVFRERRSAPAGCLGGPVGCAPAVSAATTIGLRADVQRLLGPDQRLTFSAGLGAQRLLNRADNSGLPFSRLVPRMSLGWAF
jgi:hypothetical protein